MNKFQQKPFAGVPVWTRFEYPAGIGSLVILSLWACFQNVIAFLSLFVFSHVMSTNADKKKKARWDEVQAVKRCHLLQSPPHSAVCSFLSLHTHHTWQHLRCITPLGQLLYSHTSYSPSHLTFSTPSPHFFKIPSCLSSLLPPPFYSISVWFKQASTLSCRILSQFLQQDLS